VQKCRKEWRKLVIREPRFPLRCTLATVQIAKFLIVGFYLLSSEPRQRRVNRFPPRPVEFLAIQVQLLYGRLSRYLSIMLIVRDNLSATSESEHGLTFRVEG
jgi:hypothetical protein